MPYKRRPRTPDAYSPEYRLFNRALSSKSGLKLVFESLGKAKNYRQRLHTARVIWREHMAAQAESAESTEGLFDELGGINCPFDILVITIKQLPEDNLPSGQPDRTAPAALYITKEPLGIMGLISVTFRDTGESMDLTPKLPEEEM